MGCAFQGRSHLNHEKEEFAHEHPHIKTLEEVVKTIKPTAIIGNYALYCTNEGEINKYCSHIERPCLKMTKTMTKIKDGNKTIVFVK